MNEKRFKPSDHPFVILVTVLAGLITIVIFVSGFSLQVGSWIGPEDNLLGYVDDVKVGTAKQRL